VSIYRFAYTTYKDQSDQRLLDRLSDALFVLKADARGDLAEHALSSTEVRASRRALIAFVDDLVARVRLLRGEPTDGAVDLTFTGLAARFVKVNSDDVADRLDELLRAQGRLASGQPLTALDFGRLDALQALLEEETAEGVRGLYRF
jgi:hypothetical protein